MEPEFPRPLLDSPWDDNNDLEFQVIDWFVPEDDRVPKIKDYKERYGVEYPEEAPLYSVHMFGVTKEGYSVCMQVHEFEPCFYVQLPPSKWEGKKKSEILQTVHDHKKMLLTDKYESSYMGKKTIRDIISRKFKDHLVYVKLVYRKDFWGFNNGEQFPFMKIKVKSLALFNSLKWYYQRELVPRGYKLYESNINPLLRFMHERKIDPCGWVRLNGGTYTAQSEDGDEMPMSRCQINVTAKYSDVHYEKKNYIAPLLIASFDIECTSSHGDFPVARKGYMKLAQDLVQYARANGCPTKEELYPMMAYAFEKSHEYDGVMIHQVYTKKIPSPGLINEIVSKILPEVHTLLSKARDMTNEDKDDDDDSTPDEFDGMTESNKKSYLEREIARILEGKGQHRIGLPPVQGDQIIQIGTTVHRYGSDEIVYKHIVTLKSCEPITGIVVESYQREEEVLIAWKDFIARLDPDILIGYNIFGFDMEYVWERAVELDCVDDINMGLGRLCTRRTWLAEQQLASSALGSNFLKYFDLDGIVCIDMYKVLQRDQKLDSYKLDSVATLFLGDQKNDLKPKEIFEKFKGNSNDRKVIAEYCIQDCCLVNRLFHKLKVLENNIGMGNVCSVPLSYLFMRGQGVKIFSLVAKFCRPLQMLIPVLRSFNENSVEEEEGVGYEGAIVLPPKVGIYLEDPITVFDFSSLYPSSMIERDLSHDRILLNPEKYGNLEDKGIKYITVTYDEYSGSSDKKVVSGKKEVVYAQMPNQEKGVIPSILMELLKQRKNTRKKIEYETVTTKDGLLTGLVSEVEDDGTTILKITDVEKGETWKVSKEDVIERRETFNPFEVAVLDALQLAYKITANSLYGQIGAKTSPIYLKDIAASTTATGRERILMAKDFMEKNYGAEIIYGDTDSIFCKFPCKDEHGFVVKGKEALPLAINAGFIGAKAIKNILPPPQSLEYEKTFFPFIIFSKKRYVGNLYEDDPYKKPKQKSMGIVLKRRDNAPIVKKIYGGIIDCLMNKYSLTASVEFLSNYLTNLVEGKVPLEDLIITKTLGANYKDPTRIAHRVLADRMGLRDPGNKPQVNDRIPFVYIVPPEGTNIQLQGDRVEHPDYIRDQNLRPDYRFYITNQLVKPICQIYGLCVEQLSGYQGTETYWRDIEEMLKEKETYKHDEKKRKDKVSALRISMAEDILFGEALDKLPNIIINKKASKKKTENGVLPSTKKTKTKSGSNTVVQPKISLQLIGKNKDVTKEKAYLGEIVGTVESKEVFREPFKIDKGKGKNQMQRISMFFIHLCEKGLMKLHENTDWKKSMYETGVDIFTSQNAFRLELQKSLRDFDDYTQKLNTMIEMTDNGALKEMRELHLYRNIAGFLQGVPYRIQTHTQTQTQEDA